MLCNAVLWEGLGCHTLELLAAVITCASPEEDGTCEHSVMDRGGTHEALPLSEDS